MYISMPEDCLTLLSKYGKRRQEEFGCILLSASHEVIAYKTLFKGTISFCQTSTREVFRYALLKDAVAMIIFHNHPSGNSNPSMQDNDVTEKFIAAGRIMNIQVLDHIIISRYSYFSYRARTSVFEKEVESLKVAED